MSPFVAVGAAGAHTLSEASGDSNCEIQTANQFARPDQTLPPVPGHSGDGGTGGDTGSGGSTGSNNIAEQLTESAIFGFSPLLYGRVSITDRLGRHTLGPFGELSASQASSEPDRFFWVDASTQNADNDLKGRNGDDRSNQIILGYELWRSARFQVGLAGGYEAAKSDSLNNVISGNVDSYFIGPYIGWQPDDVSLIDLWAGYASRDYDANIGPFRTSFDSDRFFFDANATRRFKIGSLSIISRIGVFYAKGYIPEHRYSNGATAFRVSGHNPETIIARASVDVWHDPIPSRRGFEWLPFVGAGIDWYAERPGDGQVLTEDLRIENVGDVIGDVSVGTDIRTQNGGRWTTRLSYVGIGLSGYDSVGFDLVFNLEF